MPLSTECISEASKLVDDRVKDQELLERVRSGEFQPVQIEGKPREKIANHFSIKDDIRIAPEDVELLLHHLASMLEARIERADRRLEALGFYTPAQEAAAKMEE